jgi:hypothetical protein
MRWLAAHINLSVPTSKKSPRFCGEIYGSTGWEAEFREPAIILKKGLLNGAW